ncbi:MAG TPA: prolyl-tRNA synthetase associated domain-containing protein [Candidatus Limnocylindrales bacterium]|nr:prolyl-tRNA synthetase associated domain-containing protein [Candidatus Limnocylindrales bacterium]
MNDIYKVLEELGIIYQKYDHPAVFTAEDADLHYSGIDGFKSKNLFLRNKKGDKHFLVIVKSTKKVDLKRLEGLLEADKLSFGSPERMMKYLGLTPGSVSPFGLINDSEKVVNVVVDKDLLEYKKVAFHPNVNTATLVIDTENFKKYLEWTKNKVTYLDL